MSGIKQRPHAITGVFVFLLLGIFAVFSTVMVLLGARAYKGTVETAATHNDLRIAPAYIRSMVRGDDERGVISVKREAGLPMIELRNEFDGDAYLTRIYCFDGALREWFADAESEFLPEDGETVCAADEMEAELDRGLLTVRLMRDGQWSVVNVALRGAE
ncbi:MAG: DUF4860 domain-containing protein [Clostridia bacterium]|nr:DUF4860 domain-containing protein [Clostridia bacterium]